MKPAVSDIIGEEKSRQSIQPEFYRFSNNLGDPSPFLGKKGRGNRGMGASRFDMSKSGRRNEK
jgi:hypothetical protein